MEQKKIETRLVHAGYDKERYLRGINPPIVRASTITFDNSDHWVNNAYKDDLDTRFDVYYGIQGVEPMKTACKLFEQLENANHAFLVASGLLAVTIPLTAFLKSGDHVIIVDNVYSPSRSFANNFLVPQYGVTVDYISPRSSIEDVEKLIKPNTVAMLLETPGSLTFEVPDLDSLYALCKANDIVSIVDNTWASGYLYKPLDHGADISIMACTKYVGGSSDLLMGSICCNDKAIAEKIYAYISLSGQFVSPDDLYLAVRGIRSLPVRMEAQYKNTLKVAQWLESRNVVKQVLYPALPSHPDHTRWKETFTGAASLFSMELDLELEQAKKFVDSLELFHIGASWGGIESLATITQINRHHDDWDDASPIVRLHIGLDHPDDLIADIQQAMEKAQSL